MIENAFWIGGLVLLGFGMSWVVDWLGGGRSNSGCSGHDLEEYDKREVRLLYNPIDYNYSFNRPYVVEQKVKKVCQHDGCDHYEFDEKKIGEVSYDDIMAIIEEDNLGEQYDAYKRSDDASFGYYVDR